MNCQEALDLLYDIVDREASEIDTKEVQAHLKKCRNCFEIYRVEESVHKFIKEKLSETKSTERLESLRSNILDNLDKVDTENQCHSTSRFLGLSMRTLTIAATLVIVMGAAVVLYSFNGHSSSYIPIEQAHEAVLASPMTFAAAGRPESVIAATARDHGYRIAQTVSGMQLVGGAIETIMDVDMMHLVYTGDGSVVSVFVAPSEAYKIPSDLADAKVVRDNITFFDHNCAGCRLVFHQMGSSVIITATSDPAVDLLEFVPGHQVI